MKIDIQDATGLPAWLQSHVSEGQLDLGALPEPEDVTGLKSALQKERANAQAWAKFESPEAVEARLADLEKQARGTGKTAEEAQQKLDALKADYEGKLTDANNRVSALMQRNASAEFKAELAKAGFIPEAIDDVLSSGMARVQFSDDGTPKVMTADGKPMIGSGADHGATLSDLAKELAAAKPYAVRADLKSGGGKPANSGGGKPAKTWAEMTSGEKVRLNQTNPEEYQRIKAAG